MNEEEVIQKTAEYVKSKLYGETTGHDWWHIQRVLNNSKLIIKDENANYFIIQMAILLHDIDDWKLNKGNFNAGPDKAREWMKSLKVENDIIEKVCNIISDLNFIGGSEDKKMNSKEGEIVQDSDRLDALGAIGIARCVATSQKLGQQIHNPDIKARTNISKEEYIKQYTGQYKNTSINHFYEKLFLIKDKMNTSAAKKIAIEREKYMKEYVKRFLDEWEGLK